MKALIIYSSKTGNTKKVAYGIYENLKDSYDLSIKDMDEINDMAMLDEYDTLVIGFWIDRGTAHPKAKKFVKQIKNKKIALFATLGADPSSKHGQDVMRNLNKLADKSNALLAVEIYNGLVDPALLEKLKTKPPLFLPKPILNKMIDSGEKSREPNEEDIQKAVSTFNLALKQVSV